MLRLDPRVALAASLTMWVLVGCDESASLVVDLRTDLAPGIEFVRVRTEYSTAPFGPTATEVTTTEELASEDADYVQRGERVAELAGLAPGTAYVRVSLLDEHGRSIVDRVTSVEVRRRVAIVVVISRACRDVVCPGESDGPDRTECLAGRCVEPGCSLERPELCGTPSCSADSDCLPDDPCAIGLCLDHECFFVGVDARCPSDQWCDPDRGCVLRPGVAVDGGVPDAGACDAIEACTGGEDDDCDGLVDCADPDCEAVACDDGSACTESDACAAGVCTGTAVSCDDTSACTEDACDPAIGCVFTPTEGPCDDGSACTTGDVCVAGVCQGDAIACDDANPCTDDTCDPMSGCTHAPNAAPCDDTFWCNGPDTCADGTCSAHPSPPCPTFCNETAETCAMCLVDADCGAPMPQTWSACSYATCAERGTRTRDVLTPRCMAGVCQVVTTTETDTTTCTRNTDGDTCGSTTTGTCGYSTACDESGTRSVTTRQCSAGSCVARTTQQSCGGRDTDGNLCGMRRTRDRCCGGSCRDIWSDEANCGGCGLRCATGLSCRTISSGPTSGDGAACYECSATSQCGNGTSRNCWSVATGGYGYCQCLTNSGCAAGQTCFTGSGTNYCHY